MVNKNNGVASKCSLSLFRTNYFNKIYFYECYGSQL